MIDWFLRNSGIPSEQKDFRILFDKRDTECKAEKNKYKSTMQKITGRFGELYLFNFCCFNIGASETFEAEHFGFCETLIGDVDSTCEVGREVPVNKLRIGHVFATIQKRKSKRTAADTFL